MSSGTVSQESNGSGSSPAKDSTASRKTFENSSGDPETAGSLLAKHAKIRLANQAMNMAQNQKIQEMTRQDDQRNRDLGYRAMEAQFKRSCLGEHDPGEQSTEPDDVNVSIDSPTTVNHYHATSTQDVKADSSSQRQVQPPSIPGWAKYAATAALAGSLGFGGMALHSWLFPSGPDMDTKVGLILSQPDGTPTPQYRPPTSTETENPAIVPRSLEFETPGI